MQALDRWSLSYRLPRIRPPVTFQSCPPSRGLLPSYRLSRSQHAPNNRLLYLPCLQQPFHPHARHSRAHLIQHLSKTPPRSVVPRKAAFAKILADPIQVRYPYYDSLGPPPLAHFAIFVPDQDHYLRLQRHSAAGPRYLHDRVLVICNHLRALYGWCYADDCVDCWIW